MARQALAVTESSDPSAELHGPVALKGFTQLTQCEDT